jgi:hypothetical protein
VPRVGEEEKGFRFLSDAEFRVLGTKETAVYLVRAQQELEERQRLLREQIKDLMRRQRTV